MINKIGQYRVSNNCTVKAFHLQTTNPYATKGYSRNHETFSAAQGALIDVLEIDFPCCLMRIAQSPFWVEMSVPVDSNYCVVGGF